MGRQAFGLASHADEHKGSYSQNEPDALRASRVRDPCMLPLEAAALEIFEPAFDPGPEPVPANVCLIWQQISQDEARMFVAIGPNCQQRTGYRSVLEANNTAAPMGTWSGHHR